VAAWDASPQVAVQPAPPPAPVVVDKQISVESIRVDSTGPLKAGDRVEVSVAGLGVLENTAEAE